MEKLNYRKIVQQILAEHASHQSDDDIEAETIFDQERDHYQVFYIGWSEERRVYGPLIHIDIKDNKIWIQCDKTERGIAKKLVELGVPKSDIVLGFQSPFKRQFTEYSAG